MTQSPVPPSSARPNSDQPSAVQINAVLSALVLAPASLSRNRYYSLFEHPQMRKVRRRAKRVRGVIRQLLGRGREHAEVLGSQVLEDGRVLLRFRVQNLAFERTVALTELEAALVNYAMHRAGVGELETSDKNLVDEALRHLGDGLGLTDTSPSP